MYREKIKKIMGTTCLIAALLMTGCGTSSNATSDSAATSDNSVTAQSTSSTSVTTTDGIDVDLKGDYSEKALDSSYDESEATKITLDGNSISVDGSGASVDGTTVTIEKKGTYIVSGSLSDGQILVNLSSDENVHLVLDGADLTNETGSAIWVQSVKNLYLTLAENSENTLSDGDSYSDQSSSDATNATLYSQSDLIINGSGSLKVNANYKDGITSKDDLTLVSGNITVNAADDGIVGKDSVTVRSAQLTVKAGGDAMKSSNTKDTSKGYVVIDGGSMTLDAGDDGIHSETALVVNDGTIQITSCVEGLESLNVVINDGTISIISSDDGVNVAGGQDSTSEDSPMGGGMDDTAIDGALVIHVGTIYVNARGDGLDSNGSILMTGGTVTVAGPEDDGNGALDYNGSFELDGGTIWAYGSSGMAQVASDGSEQTYVTASVDSFESGATIKILDSDKSEIATLTTEKTGNFVMYSSDQLISGNTYYIQIGDTTTQVTAGDSSQITSTMGGGMHGGGNAPGGRSQN